MNPVKKTELRKPIYKFVENLLGRPLTPTEHEELKGYITTYAENEAKEVKILTNALQQQGNKMRLLRSSTHRLLSKKITERTPVLEEILKILHED